MFVKEGQTAILAWLRSIAVYTQTLMNRLDAQQYKLYLITDNIAESETLTYGGSISTANKQQCDGSGIANSWGNAPADVSGVPRLTCNEITWTNSTGSSKTVYGWCWTFTDGTTTYLLNYKTFASAQVIANGAQLKFTPYLEANHV